MRVRAGAGGGGGAAPESSLIYFHDFPRLLAVLSDMAYVCTSQFERMLQLLSSPWIISRSCLSLDASMLILLATGSLCILQATAREGPQAAEVSGVLSCTFCDDSEDEAPAWGRVTQNPAAQILTKV